MTIRERVRRRLAEEDGASIVLFAITIGVVLVMAALALDLGNAVQEKRKAQGTADATALAAAQDLASGPPAEHVDEALVTAVQYAADNLGVPSVDPSIGCRGPGECFEGADGWMVSVATPYETTKLDDPPESLIHVEVCRDVPTFFAGAIGIEEVRTCARATATTNVDDRDGALPGIIALGKHKNEASRGKGTKKALHNQGLIEILDGDIQVNSRHNKEAAKLDKKSVTTADELSVVGRIAQKSPSTVNGRVRTGAPVVPDPLVDLAAPTIGSVAKAAPKVEAKGEGVVETLLPGAYGRLRVEDGATVVLQGPGVFVFSKIDLKKGGTLRSEGAMVYSTGKIKVDKSTLDLDAMDAGEAAAAGTPEYTGIALFQARCKAKDLGTPKCAKAKGEKIQLKGKKKADGTAGVWRFDGAIYAPSSKIEIKGESEAFDCASEDDEDDEDVEEESDDGGEACASEDFEDDAPFASELDVGFSRSLVVVAEMKVGKKASLEVDTEWPPAAVYRGDVALVE